MSGAEFGGAGFLLGVESEVRFVAACLGFRSFRRFGASGARPSLLNPRVWKVISNNGAGGQMTTTRRGQHMLHNLPSSV